MADTRQDDPKHKGVKGLKTEWSHIRSDYAGVFKKAVEKEHPDIVFGTLAIMAALAVLPLGYALESQGGQEFPVIEQSDAIPFGYDHDRGYIAYSANGGLSGSVIIKDDDGEYEVYSFTTAQDGRQKIHMTLTEDETVAWQTMRSLSAHYHQIYKSGLNADVAPPSDHYDLVNLGDISAPVKNANGQIIRLAQDATIMTFDNMMENSSEQAEALLAASQTIFLGQDYGLDTQELTEESGTLSLEQNSADFDKTKFIASIIGSVFLLSGGIFATRSTAQVVGRARRRRKERALKK